MVALLILITVTVLAAALATKAHLLFGSSATLCGSSPVLIVLMTVLVLVRITETVSAPGFTDHT